MVGLRELKRLDNIESKQRKLLKIINKELEGFTTFNPSLDYLRYFWEIAPTEETHEGKHCGWAKKNVLYMSKNKEDYHKHKQQQDAITSPHEVSCSKKFTIISGIIDGCFQYIILNNNNSRQYHRRKLKKEQKEKLQKLKIKNK